MKIICSNPKAFYEYRISNEYEAGMELKGSEVKSIRLGKVNIKGSYVKNIHNELFILGMNISQYPSGEELDSQRVRKLLLNKREISKIISISEQKGSTIVPLSIYLKKGLVKIKIALAKGKKLYDKRDSIAKKDQKRELDREIKKIR